MAATLAAGLFLTGEAGAAPQWSKMPDAKAMAAAYPAAPAAVRLGGRAALRCQAQVDGRLTDCVVESEQPAGLGFGAAAMKLSPLFAMRKGSPGSVTVPIRFEPAQDVLLARGERYRAPKVKPEDLALARKVVAHTTPEDWMAAKVEAYLAQDLPLEGSPDEAPEIAAAVRAAIHAAVQAARPMLMEATAVEMAGRMPRARMEAALVSSPPADPGQFLEASFKGAPPTWTLSMVGKVQADARERLCARLGCPKTPVR